MSHNDDWLKEELEQERARAGYVQVVEDGKCAGHKCALILVCPECTGVLTRDPRIRALESEVARLKRIEAAAKTLLVTVAGGASDAEWQAITALRAAIEGSKG